MGGGGVGGLSLITRGSSNMGRDKEEEEEDDEDDEDDDDEEEDDDEGAVSCLPPRGWWGFSAALMRSTQNLSSSPAVASLTPNGRS